MNISKRLGLALLLSLGTAGAAQAQESPTSTWNDSVTWRDPIDRSVDLSRAEAQKRARNGGYGPGQVVTTYNGDVTYNEANEFNGSVTNNSATTATNLNSFQSTVRQDGSGNGASVVFTTGNTAYNTSQNATATNAQSSSGSASNTTTSDND